MQHSQFFLSHRFPSTVEHIRSRIFTLYNNILYFGFQTDSAIEYWFSFTKKRISSCQSIVYISPITSIIKFVIATLSSIIHFCQCYIIFFSTFLSFVKTVYDNNLLPQMRMYRFTGFYQLISHLFWNLLIKNQWTGKKLQSFTLRVELGPTEYFL